MIFIFYLGEPEDGGLVRLPLELSCAYFDHLELLENSPTFRYNPRPDITLNENQQADTRVKLSYSLDVKNQSSKTNLFRFSNVSVREMLEGAMVAEWDEGITAPGEDVDGDELFKRYFEKCKPRDCLYYEEPERAFSSLVTFVLVGALSDHVGIANECIWILIHSRLTSVCSSPSS